MQDFIRNKRNLLLIGLVLLILIALLLFVYPGFLIKHEHYMPLENKRFTMWDQQSLAEQINPDQKLSDVFQKNFLKEIEIDGKKSGYSGVISSISLNKRAENQESSELNLTDQLLWGRYLASSKQKKAFQEWRDMIEHLFLQEDHWVTQMTLQNQILAVEQKTWNYDLQYAEVLLTAYNINPTKDLFRQIERMMQRALPYFEDPEQLADYQVSAERILYPETSSSDRPTENPELLNPYREENIIRLSDINLFVLHSFALIDQTWQPIYEQWAALIEQSIEPESQFYPLGIYADLKNYLTTGNQAFAVSTYDNLKMIYQSEQIANTKTLSFYKRALLRTNTLDQSYHLISLQGLQNQDDIISLAIFAEFLSNELPKQEAETQTLLNIIANSLSTKQYHDQFNTLDQLFYEKDNQETNTFYAAQQIHILLTGFQFN